VTESAPIPTALRIRTAQLLISDPFPEGNRAPPYAGTHCTFDTR
jgi:hypothetical protein